MQPLIASQDKPNIVNLLLAVSSALLAFRGHVFKRVKENELLASVASLKEIQSKNPRFFVSEPLRKKIAKKEKRIRNPFMKRALALEDIIKPQQQRDDRVN